MRILMLNYEFPPLGGGGGVAAKKLAEGFIKLGYQVDYITTRYNDSKKYEKVDGIDVYRINVIGRKEQSTASILSLISFPFLAYGKACKLCKVNQYSFINTHFAIPTGPLGIWLSRKYSLRNVLSIYGGDIYDPSKNISPHKKWYLKRVVQWVLSNSRYVVAESSNIKENALQHYNIEKDINIVPVAYEPVTFEKINRKDLDLDENLFYTISIGRLVKRKGFEFLIKAIKNTPSNVHALIIGEGPEKENLVNLANELHVSDRIHFLGFVSESKKFQYLQNSNIYVLSSVHEGFGIVLQEAMQVGLPIISTDNGGQVDIIKEGMNGYLVRFGDVETLAGLINKLEQDNQLRINFSELNKKEIKKFENKQICKEYLMILG